MASTIDPTNPITGLPTTKSVRDNFAAAKTEIEALQLQDSAVIIPEINALDVRVTANTNAIITKLDTAGGTMAGPLTLAGAPTVALDAATKKYVDDNAGGAPVLPYTLTPAMNGVGSAGVATTYARGDHVHPVDTSRAPLASPSFTGAPSLPTGSVGVTQTPGNSSLALATTAFVAVSFATIASLPAASAVTPVMNGVGAVGVAATFSRGDHVHPSDTSRAPTASPTFTGTVTLPTTTVAVTQTAGNNTTAPATTAFVTAAVPAASAVTPAMNGTGAVGVATAFSRGDHVHPSDTSRAPTASPTFTGTVTLPTGTVGVTQTLGTNTTALATTAFVLANAISAASPTFTGTVTLPAAVTTAVAGTTFTSPNSAGTATSGAVTMTTGSGTTSNSQSGAHNVLTGNAVGSGVSGNINLTTGTSVTGVSGDINLTTGVASGNWSGNVYIKTGAEAGANWSGTVALSTGNASGSGGGGDISLNPGNAAGAGNGGTVSVNPGATATGTGGSFNVQTATATTTGKSGGVLLSTGSAATVALRGIVNVNGRTFIKPAGGGTAEDDVASDLQVIGNSRVSGSMIVGAAAGPTIRSGTGAATGTQPAGSMWLRTDGSAGARVYISAGAGTWVPIAAV